MSYVLHCIPKHASELVCRGCWMDFPRGIFGIRWIRCSSMIGFARCASGIRRWIGTYWYGRNGCTSAKHILGRDSWRNQYSSHFSGIRRTCSEATASPAIVHRFRLRRGFTSFNCKIGWKLSDRFFHLSNLCLYFFYLLSRQVLFASVDLALHLRSEGTKMFPRS